MTPKNERFELRLDSEILERIDKWRGGRPDLPSRSEAVRQLVEAGLGRPEDKQLFQIARFNVLVAAKAELLPDAYAYAWANGVYPLFHEVAYLHEPFAAQFEVTKEMLEELGTYLDDRWLAKNVPSFYKLEDHYEVRLGVSGWNRHRLVAACRYMFLDGSFDKPFWDALLKGSDHPSEAKAITQKFNVKDDIYFA